MGLWGRKVSNLGFVEFMLSLEEKAAQRGKKVIKIDRFDPLSQTCSVCGTSPTHDTIPAII